MNHASFFSDLRAALQQPPSADTWHEVQRCLHLRPPHTYLGDLTSSECQQIREFIAQYEDYISHALASWPDHLRESNGAQLKEIESFSRFLHHSLHEPEMPQYDDICGSLAHFTGIALDWCRSEQAIQSAKTWCGALSPRLTHFGVLLYNLPMELVCEFIDWIVAHYADSLQHLSLGYGWDDRGGVLLDDMWQRLYDHLPRLTAIKGLYFTSGLSNTQEDWLTKFLAHPALDDLEFLSCSSHHDNVYSLNALIERPASQSLRALRLTRLSNDELEVLARAPTLSGVHTWDTSSGQIRRETPFSWDPCFTTYTRSLVDRYRGVDTWETHPLLQTHHVSLDRLDAFEGKAIKTTLFDAQGRIYPAPVVERLCLGLDQSRDPLAYLEPWCEQVSDHYPMLQHLETTYALTPNMLKLIDASGLPKQLLSLNAGNHVFRECSDEEREQWVTGFIEVMRDERLHISTRLFAWHYLSYTSFHTAKHFKRLASLLGLKGYSKLKREELKDFLHTHGCPLDLQAPHAYRFDYNGWTLDQRAHLI